MKTLPFFLQSIQVACLLSLTTSAWAGTVTKNDNRKIILEFDGDDVPAIDDRLYILDQETHKEIGLIEIKKVKGNRALGTLLKGKAKPGDSTDIAKSKHKKDDDREPAEEANTSRSRGGNSKNHVNRSSYGIGMDFVYTSMYTKNDVGEGAITGNGFGLRGAMDMPITNDWTMLASLGYHPFNVVSATSGYERNITINYLAIEGLARYILDKRNEGLWIAGGLGYYLPMSTNESGAKPKSQLTFIGSAGYNMRLSRDYFTLKGDFVYFTPSEESGEKRQSMQIVLGGVYFF